MTLTLLSIRRALTEELPADDASPPVRVAGTLAAEAGISAKAQVLWGDATRAAKLAEWAECTEQYADCSG